MQTAVQDGNSSSCRDACMFQVDRFQSYFGAARSFTVMWKHSMSIHQPASERRHCCCCAMLILCYTDEMHTKYCHTASMSDTH